MTRSNTPIYQSEYAELREPSIDLVHNSFFQNKFYVIPLGVHKGYKDQRRLRCYNSSCTTTNFASCSYCSHLPYVPSPLREVVSRNYEPLIESLLDEEDEDEYELNFSTDSDSSDEDSSFRPAFRRTSFYKNTNMNYSPVNVTLDNLIDKVEKYLIDNDTTEDENVPIHMNKLKTLASQNSLIKTADRSRFTRVMKKMGFKLK